MENVKMGRLNRQPVDKGKFRPVVLLDKFYNNKKILAFKAKNKKEYNLWKKELRKKLIELLGSFPEKKVSLKPKILSERAFKTYIRRKIILQTEANVLMPLYLLFPKNLKEPQAAVIALHGHGYGKDDLVGLWENGTERKVSDGYHKDFALEIVKRGLVVIVPEILCFGERREVEDIKSGPNQSSCRKSSLYAMLLEKSILGLRIWDVMRTIDYLQTLSFVNKKQIGCMGISGGGMLTLFSAALDERIKVVVVSGYLNTFRDSIVNIYHCECNYVPGILKYAEMYDIAGLIAPRPLLIESGTKDDIFPIEATKKAYNKVKRVYKLLGKPECLEKDFFEGRHQISGAKAYDWLKLWLKGNV